MFANSAVSFFFRFDHGIGFVAGEPGKFKHILSYPCEGMQGKWFSRCERISSREPNSGAIRRRRKSRSSTTGSPLYLRGEMQNFPKGCSPSGSLWAGCGANQDSTRRARLHVAPVTRQHQLVSCDAASMSCCNWSIKESLSM